MVPLVPVYLASLVGPDILDKGAKRQHLPIFLHSFSFIIGFSIVFVALGVVAGLAGLTLPSSVVSKIAGSLLIVFGLFMLAAGEIGWLNYEGRFYLPLGATTGHLRSFLIGASLSLGWTVCAGPILGGILALSLESATVWRGAYLLALYSLGLGLPFLIIGVAFDALMPLLKGIYRYSNLIYIISGLLLIVIGGLILANRLTWFASLAS